MVVAKPLLPARGALPARDPAQERRLYDRCTFLRGRSRAEFRAKNVGSGLPAGRRCRVPLGGRRRLP